MSVVGFDIGNGNCVIASVKDGGIDVLLNAESNRETPSVVSFGEKQRFLGSTAAASAMMNPKSTISQVKRLVGLNFRQANVKDELRLFPFETSEGPYGSVLIHLQYLGETHTFSPVQILAMLLSHLKEVTEKSLEKPISDCVIGIPSYFTNSQRRGYLDAAKLAGLEPLRLMHDCTATALGYGIYKKDFSSAGPINVVFIDVGHCDTQVTVASFWAGRMKILSHAFDSCLGGRDFDEVLFNYFARKFWEQYHIDVYSNIRASIRLRAACEKLKKVLSANAEAPLNIECLMDEKDVNSFIQREEFEKLSSSLVERISFPCNKALSDADLTVDKIYSVELVGSGSRVPVISKMVSSLFNREPSRRLNVSECVARGCALQCAMLSPSFRGRDYEVQDSSPFSIGLSSEEGPIRTLSNGILFRKGQPIPSLKVPTLHRASMFPLYVHYVDKNELPSGASLAISRFGIGPFQVSNAQKVKVNVQLNIHGIVLMESESLVEQVDGNNTRRNSNSNAKKVSSETVIDSVEDGVCTQPETSSMPHLEEQVDGNNTRRNSNSNAKKVSSETVIDSVEDGVCTQPETSSMPHVDGTRNNRVSSRIKLPIHETVFGVMTNAQLLKARDIERSLRQQDQLIERTKEKKNALEAYVYEMRNKLHREYQNYATDFEREDISINLKQTADWLYDDGACVSETVYSAKMQDLKKLVDPIESRYRDEESRSQATKNMLEEHVDGNNTRRNSNSNAKKVSSETVIDSVEDGVCTQPETSSMPPVLKECFKAEEGIRNSTHKQSLLPKNTDPLLRTSYFRMAAKGYKQLFQPSASPPQSEDNRGPNPPRPEDNRGPNPSNRTANMVRINQTKDMEELIGNYRMAAKSHPPGGERDAVLVECLKVENWLRNITHQQSLSPKNTDSLHWTNAIRNAAEHLDKTFKQLLQPRASPPQSEERPQSTTAGR